MAEYLYKHQILTDQNNVLGYDLVTEAADKLDFDTNFKNSCIAIDSLLINETTFVIEKTYAQFKALIDGTIITWADVKLLIDGRFYYISLITDTPL